MEEKSEMKKATIILRIVWVIVIIFYSQISFAWWAFDVVKTKLWGFQGARSIAIGNDEKIHVIYAEPSSIYYAYRDGLAWHAEIIAENQILNGGSNIILDSNGMPHMIFVGSTYNGNEFEHSIYYATNCSGSWVTEKIASHIGEDAFSAANLALDSNDIPHINYIPSPRDVRYAYKDSTGWHTEIIYEDNAYHSLMTLDSYNNPHIIYEGGVNVFTYKGSFEHAYKDTTGWHTEIINGDDVQSLFQILYSNGIIHALYEKADQLWYAYKDSTGWHAEIINEEEIGYNPSMILNSMGNPLISYTSFLGDYPVFYFIHKDDTGWHAEEFYDEPGLCSSYSMALDLHDNPHMNYLCKKRNYTGAWFEYHTEYILKYATRIGESWHIESLDSAHTFAIPWFKFLVTVFGDHISDNFSMALDLNGKPHVLYLKNRFNYITLLYLFSEPDDSSGITSLKYATWFDFVK